MSEWISMRDKSPTQVGWYFACKAGGELQVMTIGLFRNSLMWNPPNSSIQYDLSHFDYWQLIHIPADPNTQKIAPQVSADRSRIFELINKERDRQDRNFRPMPHNMAPTGWFTVLMEEVGEVARAILEGDVPSYEKELIEVAASAVAAIEDLRAGDNSRSLEEIVSWRGRVNQWLMRIKKSLIG